MGRETSQIYLFGYVAPQQIVGRERRERLSQLAWCGEGCFESRRRVNSTVICFSSSQQFFFRSSRLVHQSWQTRRHRLFAMLTSETSLSIGIHTGVTLRQPAGK